MAPYGLPAEPPAPVPSPGTLLELTGIDKVFGGLVALSDVSITVPERTIFSIIGPNGSGKTTLLNIINGLLRPTAGEIRLDGRPIEKMKPHARARSGIARTFQHPRVFGSLTVLDNVRVGGHIFLAGRTRLAARRAGQEPSSEAEARKVLDLVELPRSKENVPANSLSLREQRALELARALMMQPRLLLLDEPAAGMDPAERPAWVAHMRDVQASQGLTMILVEHSMKIISEISDWVVVLSSGRVLAQGSAENVLRDPQVRRVYIGRGASSD